MTNEKIANILEKHYIPYFEQDNRIYADSMQVGTAIFEEVEDLTGYSRHELLAWLGY
jgi:hypothetical protein